ncbi:MAG: FAD:protein FMN transferase [Chlamydiales bacterium]|nr:FAD:protein FMN transferase [Chlamydiales bacterium]MCH9636091.1 FAD:protein FMN transferase [Chlamydiales bacterium]MCH9703152.1 FAD:protein FMN transferase [Chlamydiota bacterium]
MRKLITLLLLASCSFENSPSQTKTYDRTIWTMPLHISSPRKGNVDAIIRKTFKQINQTFNNYNSKSEISKLNQAAAYQHIELSPHLAELLKKVGEIVEITEGRFDPTVAPLVHMWKTHLKNGEIPKKEAIEALKPAIGWHNVHIEGNTFYKEDARTQIDLSGIAKGYAVDLLKERLGPHSYVEWGGEIAVSNSHPTGRPWRVKIFGGEIVEVEDKAVATSGSYLQKWWVEDKEYTHLIDPRTKEPLLYGKGLVSATVVAKSCMEADAIATSLMFFSTKEEAQTWASHLDVEVQLIPYTPDWQ